MIFNTTDNRTKFDRLKRSTSNVSIPFNAGRRTGFKATAAASDIRMEDWITSKIASGAIELSTPQTTMTDGEFENLIGNPVTGESQIVSEVGTQLAEIALQTKVDAENDTNELGEAEINIMSAADEGSVQMIANSHTGTPAAVKVSSDAGRTAINLVGVPEFADNSAADIGGLQVGDLYHTAGAVKIVL